MEIQINKCSLKEHSDINANIYCTICEKIMCEDCEAEHSKSFQNHQTIILNETNEESTNEYCKEEKHHNFQLNYFCKTHDKLCCAACISKIKGEKKGQHVNCLIWGVNAIKEEKKSKIKENIKLLEELSSKFNESLNGMKKMLEQINEKKQKLKTKIQDIFTILKDALNNRENELLLNVDKEYDNLLFKDNLEKIPAQINLYLEKCKNIDELDNDIYKLINECSEIESNVNIIKTNINNIYESKNKEIQFIPEENGINEFIDSIQNFGNFKIIKTEDNNIENFSSMIKDNSNNELISKWIEEEVNKKEIKFELIFKMSENGNQSEDFHKYCDNQGPTLTLIKTINNKIFGGFTPLNWKNKGFWIRDLNNQTFVFSLDMKKKYKSINENSDGIFCFDIYGPNFGGSYFWLKQNMKKGEAYSNKDNNLFFNHNSKTKGKDDEYESFEAEDFEVYKVLY